MRGNSFGQLFTITTFGESHGPALGCVIDGMPSNIEVSIANLQLELDKRRPGRLDVSTSRNEADQPEILSGVFEGKTLGTPICIVIRNQNQRSKDYEKLREEYRPGHADKTTQQKYGIRDHRGGGRASGRETVARVIGGYFAGLIVKDIRVQAYISQIGKFQAHEFREKDKLGFADPSQTKELESFLLDLKKKGESIGGSIFLRIQNCPPGLGDPVFDKFKSILSHALLSIGSCMSVEFGRGREFAELYGSEISEDSKNFSGIEGGITNGDEIYCVLSFKAPSTIGEKAKEGRHDPCILPRVVPVVEAMTKITLADLYLSQRAFG
ncbi:MAG: chorismate synthase [Halobacteriovoraceae bacterium]|nr:chorismate synthase [Halobacteriovoraceae bacterium]|tara:strand:- start:930 stop:1904 length:975 start_codon:yes stop_codon:yes gene_type:complete